MTILLDDTPVITFCSFFNLSSDAISKIAVFCPVYPRGVFSFLSLRNNRVPSYRALYHSQKVVTVVTLLYSGVKLTPLLVGVILTLDLELNLS